MKGQTNYERFVILEYPTFDAALRYYRSQEFQTAVALRRDASDNETILVDGVSDGVGTDA